MTCPLCQGEGYIAHQPCKPCRSTGTYPPEPLELSIVLDTISEVYSTAATLAQYRDNPAGAEVILSFSQYVQREMPRIVQEATLRYSFMDSVATYFDCLNALFSATTIGELP